MIVDYAIYRNGERVAEPRELTHMDAACRDGGGIAWVGLYRPTQEEFDASPGSSGCTSWPSRTR